MQLKKKNKRGEERESWRLIEKENGRKGDRYKEEDIFFTLIHISLANVSIVFNT